MVTARAQAIPALPPAAPSGWRPSSPPQGGTDRPGFWCRIEPAAGYGTSWTAALNGEIHTDPYTGRPHFFPSAEAAQVAILEVAREVSALGAPVNHGKQ
jgi:hypothetical protein